MSHPVTHSHSHSASSTKPPPRRLLPRSPSDPVHLAQQSSFSHNGNSNSQPIYVLTADGSSLFLLDPTKPLGNEQPPPYASFTPTDNVAVVVNRAPTATGLEGEHGDRGEVGGYAQAAASPHRRTVPSPAARAPMGLGSESGLGEISFPSSSRLREDSPPSAAHNSRVRASTLSATTVNAERSRPRLTSSLSHRERRTRSTLPTPETHTVSLVDESTPLLFQSRAAVFGVGADSLAEPGRNRRGLWRSIFCGDLDADEESGGWGKGWRRYWRPIGRGEYWRPILHLVLLNFPFALFVWPPLVAGTLAGTALLITLPIGAAVWWLTLFLSRSAARLETIMQLRYHSPVSPTAPLPTRHPIFYRVRERSAPSSPYTPISEIPSPYLHHHTSNDTAPLAPTSEAIWERRFLKCSYAMFCDHYSYSALSYFLLLKPLITLFSIIAIVVLGPVALASVIGWPVFMRVMRRWGRWQAEVALDSL